MNTMFIANWTFYMGQTSGPTSAGERMRCLSLPWGGVDSRFRVQPFYLQSGAAAVKSSPPPLLRTKEEELVSLCVIGSKFLVSITDPDVFYTHHNTHRHGNEQARFVLCKRLRLVDQSHMIWTDHLLLSGLTMTIDGLVVMGPGSISNGEARRRCRFPRFLTCVRG